MSMKRLAILSAAGINGYGGLNNTAMNPTPGSPHAPVHGVNVMLGGAMLSGIILVVFILCYCCHKNGRKPEPNLPYYWREPVQSVEIYTLEGQNCFGSEEFPICDVQQQHRIPPLAPPPPYESVVAEAKDKCPARPPDNAATINTGGLDGARRISADETGLPSYEAATQLAAVAGNGYV